MRGPAAGEPTSLSAGIACSGAAFAELSRDLLLAGRSVRLRARGGSMSPLVRDGDLILVRPIDADVVRVGDVVIVRDEPDRLVVHRVVRRHSGPGGPAFTVQGDQVVRPDGVFPAAQLYGRVVTIERDGRRIELDGPAMGLLGRLAALRSRWSLARGRRSRMARSMVRKLPGISRYLA